MQRCAVVMSFLIEDEDICIVNSINQEFALGFSLVYIHDKDWLCFG